MAKVEQAHKVVLKVAEAPAKDVGRGIVRIDPKDMESLGVEVGDVILLKGKRESAARVMPAFAEDRGKGTIQMDGLIRENVNLGIDEKAHLLKLSVPPAEKVVLAPLTLGGALHREHDARYIGKLLEGLPVTKGDRIRANLFGTKSLDFRVVAISPNGHAQIYGGTSLVMDGGGPKAEKEKGEARISYEDIGGLGNQTQKIREMIELPLRFPEIFQKLGIDPPKGVFLYGPPGCGKTLIAKAVANETDAYFTHISGPEIMGKFYGESEGRLRSVFEDAQAHAPAILFIDEIDAIAPKREEMGGEKQVERRVVAQLLALMDGLESRGQLIVIAATNIPNSIDPALRRPGRFDREIEIPIPDKNSRLEILEIHTRGMPLTADVDLKYLASITHGFVGADLEALCREAAMRVLRKIFPKVDYALNEIPYETLEKLEVTREDFLDALKDVEPSAMREVFVEVPDVSWNDVGGLRSVKRELREAVEWPLLNPEVFQHTHVKPIKGILLAGPPGTGKTLLARALAHESGVNFISVKGPELFSKYIGESERGIREIFRKAKQASPCIIFFDEIDAVVPQRGTGGGEGLVAERVISQFLTELDGIEELRGVVVLAATNRLDRLDPALIRPGRFDLVIRTPLPDAADRKEILGVHLKEKPLSGDVDLKEILKKSEGLSGADMAGICQRAAFSAIRRFIEDSKSKKKRVEEIKITQEDFNSAWEAIHPR